MAKTLTISDSNFLPQYESNSARILENIQNKTNVLHFRLTVAPGQFMPQEGGELVFKDDDRFLFGGYVTRIDPLEHGKGAFFVYDVEASDYGWILNNKRARKAYSNTTLKAIVEDLLDTYAAGYNFSTTNVQTGPTIDSIMFDHISLRRCFEKLSKLTGYIWWVDYEKTLYFQDRTYTSAPESITDTSGNFHTLSLTYDTTQVRNSVIVIGSENGEESASTRTETFVADGTTRSWTLEDKPSTIVTIKLDGVEQQFSLELNARDTDDFLYSFNDKRIYVAPDIATPTAATEIEIVYYPRIPIIVERSSSSSIALIAALDGGDGIYEYTIKEPSIRTKAEARARAEKELQDFALPLVKGIFETRTSLLEEGSVFAPGQILTTNLPSWGISGDVAFLVQQVDIELIDGDPSEYLYTVRFGGKIVDIETFLSTLSDTGSEVQNVDEIKTIFRVSDSLSFSDDSPVHTKYTPPFQVGPGGSPQAVVNKSEVS